MWLKDEKKYVDLQFYLELLGVENSEARTQSLKNATNLLHIHTTIGFVEIEKEFDCMRGSETP